MATYYELQADARQKWMQAQRLTDTIECLYAHNRIDDDRKYEMFQEVRTLQETAARLERQAADLVAEYWKQRFQDQLFCSQYAEDVIRIKEYQEQMRDERP
jgi:hypothetical protein